MAKSMIKALKTKGDSEDTLTIDEFLKSFQPDKIGTNFCKRLNEQFVEDQRAELSEMVLKMVQEKDAPSTQQEIISQKALVKILVNQL